MTGRAGTAGNLRRALAQHGLRWLLGCALTALACAQVVGLLPAGVDALVGRLDSFIYDMRLRVQAPRFDPRIVIVDIDSRSLTEFGRWPWSRDVVARLVGQLADKYQARAVTFDVMFPEPDTSSGYGTLAALADGELRDIPAFRERVRALRPALDYDARLAEAIRGRPVVLAYSLTHGAAKGLLPPPAFGAAELNGFAADAYAYSSYEANLPQLQQSAAAAGYMTTGIDEDGLLRRTPLIARIGDDYYESLALATARVALGATAVLPVFPSPDSINSEDDLRRYGVLDAIALDTQPRATLIPVGRGFTTLIQFRGRGGPHAGAFRYVSAADVLQGRLAAEDLLHRIFIVGTTATGLNDLRATPVNSEYPGVEALANVVASILDGEFKQQPDYSLACELLQIVLVGLLLAVALPMLSPLLSIVLAAAVAAAVGAFNLWMFQALDAVLPVATALLLVLALFVLNVAWGYLFEYRKGRAIVNLFGEYVAPELVAEMAGNPETYSMEGESRELTVLFADVRGFTTISEGLDPNTLREYINHYLTAMSEDIRGNRGTLDKYIGDAVMAFWGAPLALPDHAARAVATALRMQATAQRLNRDFVARGWPALKIGIGLNTGDMRVGDMGSKVRRAYTVMGDAVNLCSRLEGITKTYGVGIVVGEATRLAAPQFAYRELDRVRVRGKSQPVPIFEPLAPAGELDDAQQASLAQWHEALALVRAQQWEAAGECLRRLQRAAPDDGLYALYLERIAHFRRHAPDPGWDGVTTFETK